MHHVSNRWKTSKRRKRSNEQRNLCRQSEGMRSGLQLVVYRDQVLLESLDDSSPVSALHELIRCSTRTTDATQERNHMKKVFSLAFFALVLLFSYAFAANYYYAYCGHE